MLKRHGVSASALALLPAVVFLAAPAGAARKAGPTALEILKKAQATVDSAKTYQSTILLINNAGQMGTMNLRMDLKIAGKKKAMTTVVVGRPTGPMAIAAGMAGNQIVDDGTTRWIYSPSKKQYAKQPSGKGKAGGAPFQDLSNLTKNANVKLGPSENVGGKPAYVILITSKAPGGKGQDVKVYIDQATYHLRQMKMNTMAPGIGGGTPQKVSMVMQVQNAKFNEPIPESVFRFTPPPGSTEVKGGMPGMGSGRLRLPR